jgi:hypothetical protein
MAIAPSEVTVTRWRDAKRDTFRGYALAGCPKRHYLDCVRFRHPLAVATALLVFAAPASATTSQEAVSFLNQQRQANSIPSSVRIDDYRTTGCHNHNRYMEQNGLGHMEDPSKPGYTPEGADYTNSGEVLAQGGSGFTATSNPWDTAPLHQSLLFDPRVNSAGYDEDQGFYCMRFGFDFTAPAQPTFYAFTSDTGRVGVPFREVVAGEGPYAPQEAVGIDQGVPTGPNIIFFAQGFGSSNHAVLYSLTSADGRAVEVKLVDSTTEPPPKGNGFKAFTTGGDMIPVQPLWPATSYTAKVLWQNDDSGQNLPQSVTFTTAGEARSVTLSLSKKLSKSRRTTLSAPAAAVGQRASVRIQLAKKGKSLKTVSSKGLTLKRSQTVKVPKPSKGGRAVVRVTLPTFVVDSTRYDTKPVSRTYR